MRVRLFLYAEFGKRRSLRREDALKVHPHPMDADLQNDPAYIAAS